MINEDFVYSRIGMALVSAQRVEFITGELLKYLVEYDKVFHGITSEEFYNASKKSKNARMMLGQIFGLLKLNPQFSINDEMDTYLKRRNLLVHGFWHNYLNTKSETQSKIAVDFCNKFGKLSNKLESFFKGFMYFLALRHVKDSDHLDEGFKSWDNDFEFFKSQVKQNKSTST